MSCYWSTCTWGLTKYMYVCSSSTFILLDSRVVEYWNPVLRVTGSITAQSIHLSLYALSMAFGELHHYHVNWGRDIKDLWLRISSVSHHVYNVIMCVHIYTYKQEKDEAAAQPYCGNFECEWMQYG